MNNYHHLIFLVWVYRVLSLHYRMSQPLSSKMRCLRVCFRTSYINSSHIKRDLLYSKLILIAPQSKPMEWRHALERTVEELDAIRAIYGTTSDNGGDGVKSVIIHSEVELLKVRSALDTATDESWTVPCHLDIEIKVKLTVPSNNGVDEHVPASLRCKLPFGYPLVPAAVTVSVAGMHRCTASHHQLFEILNKQALVSAESDSEAIMDLVQILEEHGSTLLREMKKKDTPQISIISPSPSTGFGRRWIWAHHILDSDRRKSIIAEALQLGLGGFLKSGYPGVVVIEGKQDACEEYVLWIKGNKSRPGGFGRNWGHHVRGEVNHSLPPASGGDYVEVTTLTTSSSSTSLSGDETTAHRGRVSYAKENDVNVDKFEDKSEKLLLFVREHRQLPEIFSELEELSSLGQICKSSGLECEFLEFVMQHNNV